MSFDLIDYKYNSKEKKVTIISTLGKNIINTLKGNKLSNTLNNQYLISEPCSKINNSIKWNQLLII